MTRLLVSVRSATEAADALQGGAQLIDVKEPDAGSLGAAAPGTIAAVLRIVAGRVELSAALGELCEPLALERAADLPLGVRYAKFGLSRSAGADWIDRWRTAIERLPEGAQGVAVAYADWRRAAAPDPYEVLCQAVDVGATTLLVDTCDKSRGGLTTSWPLVDLAEFAASVRTQGLKLVLAGSLQLEDLPQLAPLAPDYFAVRGAVCRGSRESALSSELVKLWRARLAATSPLMSAG